jgi:hypothetical protein
VVKGRKVASLNDQKPKPRLGNSPMAHGHVSVDWSGGANPPVRNPGKAGKKR